MQSTHDLNIKRLERVSCWLDEVDASVYAVVHNVHTIDLILSIEVSVKSLLNVLDDGSPRVIIVDEVAKARCVNHCKP